MELPSEKNGLLYDGLRAVDSLIAKALGVGYAAQIRQIEKRLARYINKEWNDLVEEAAVRTSEMIKKGAGPSVVEADVEAAIATIDYTMGQWVSRVTNRFVSDMKEVYELGKYSASKKVSVAKAAKPKVTTWIKPSFDLVDSSVIEAYSNHQKFWIGNFYSSHVSNTVAAASKTQVLEGEGRIRAGKRMYEVAKRELKNIHVPNGYSGSTGSYFEGLVANATTVERTTGHLRSFADAGYTVYSISNPTDHRTCRVCGLMHGKQFRTQDGIAQVGKVITAPTPAAIRSIHPWMTPSSAAKLTGNRMGPMTPDKTEALRKAGHAMPTYHMFCRCDLDIIERAVPGAPIDSDLPPLVKPPSSVIPPTPSKPKPKPKTPRRAPKPAAPPPQITQPTPAVPQEARYVRPGLPSATELRKRSSINYSAFKSSEKKGYRAYRNNLAEDLKLWGLESTDPKDLGMAVGTAGDMPGIHGLHWPDGKIALRQDMIDMMPKAYDAIQDNMPYSRHLRAIRVIYHELIHGANRITGTIKASAGRFISEVTTELAARRIALDFTGAVRSDAYTFAFGSYGMEINDLHYIVMKSTGWNITEAAEVIEHAALSISSPAAKVVTSDADVVDEFIRLMGHKKEISEPAAKKLKSKLLKVRLRDVK